VLSAALGANWMDVLCGRSPAFLARKTNWEAARAKEQRSFGDAYPRRLLDYSYPMELWEVVTLQWQDFRGLFGRDKAYWAERFSVIAKVRNPVAHNRDAVVPAALLTTAQGYCLELMQVTQSRHNG
jgi:hypothetical protein